MQENRKMLTKLGEFIRKSRVAQKTLGAFISRGGIQHTISYENNLLSYKNTDENDNTLHKLIMSTRTFVEHNSRFNAKRIFNGIQEMFPSRISSKQRDEIQKVFSEIERPTGIKMQDREIHHLELYHMMANEFYFRKKSASKDEIISMCFSNPISAGIAKICFERVLLLLCDLSSRISKVAYEIRGAEYANSDIRKQCIFCNGENASYNSEEHILPFDINNELILPRGYVCDRCNNGLLSILDRIFLKFPPVNGVVAFHSSFTRKGEFREVKFQNAFLKHTGPGMLEVHYHSDKKSSRPETIHKNGLFKFNTEFVGSVMTEKGNDEFRIALLKVALEMIAYDRGHAEALLSKYDFIRKAIRTKGKYNVNVLISTQIVPASFIRVFWDERDDVHAFVIGIYGLGISFTFKSSNEVLERFDIPEEMKAKWL